MTPIEIHTPYITLGQLLKLTDTVTSGGEAKTFLASARIAVNGKPENRRGRKLVPGDLVAVNEETYQIRAE